MLLARGAGAGYWEVNRAKPCSGAPHGENGNAVSSATQAEAASIPMPTLDHEARRNLFLLTTCQAFGQAANTMLFLSTALSVITFMRDRELATLPITLQHLGIMLAAFPAGMLMQRYGRRFGFRLGSVVGILGAALGGLGLYLRNFPLMCLGGFVHGYAVCNVQMYRFAAVELVPGAWRAKAISWVTTGGVAAGFIGPALARYTHDLMVPIFVASYVAAIGLHVIVIAVMSFIRFPVLHDAAPAAGPVGARTDAALPARTLWEIAIQPRFIAAVVSAMVAYGTMSFLMSASPLAVVNCGLPATEANWVMFMHVMGMFVPSFFTGHLITRYGLVNIMFWGAAILLFGVVAALAGITEWHFRISLAMNGIGWNFLFVGATTLVTTCYRPSERGKAQSLNDFLVFGTTTTASFFAGFLQERLGWAPLNWSAIALICVALLAVGWLRVQRPPQAA